MDKKNISVGKVQDFTRLAFFIQMYHSSIGLHSLSKSSQTPLPRSPSLPPQFCRPQSASKSSSPLSDPTIRLKSNKRRLFQEYTQNDLTPFLSIQKVLRFQFSMSFFTSLKVAWPCRGVGDFIFFFLLFYWIFWPLFENLKNIFWPPRLVVCKT